MEQEKNVLRNVTEILHDTTPRVVLVRIEVYVCFAIALLIFLVIFGSFRRRCRHSFVQLLIWAAFLLSSTLISYTMGQMQSASNSLRNHLFAVWAIFFLFAFGCVDSITAYSLEDNEQRKRLYCEMLILFFWLGWLLGYYDYGKEFKVSNAFLYVLTYVKVNERFEACILASRNGLVRYTKPFADFMSYEHELSNEVDATTMKGYKYLVRGEQQERLLKKKLEVQRETGTESLELPPEMVTLEEIWQCRGRLLKPDGDPDGRLKDICLSFALFKLLSRRFAGYAFAESSQEKTWNFVRHGLLSEDLVRHGLLSGDRKIERVFRIIEAELAFVYDLFYTKYAVMFGLRFRISKVVGIIAFLIGCFFAAITLRKYQLSMDKEVNNLTPKGHNLDVFITGLVIAAILLVEFFQLILSVVSDWAKVMLLCTYVQSPQWQSSRAIENMIGLICRIPWLKPWERKLGQYSFLKSFHKNPCKIMYNSLTSVLVDHPGQGREENSHVKLSPKVKKAVFLSLKASNRILTNGVESLSRNEVRNKFKWACKPEKQAQVINILVWHIATSVCENSFRQSEKEENFIVASSLSQYCAYLVAFAPRLLPGHHHLTECIFSDTVDEANSHFKGYKSMEIRCKRMLTLREAPEDGRCVIRSAAVLARQLIDEGNNQELLWKILADFWAEMMLFVAHTSDDATAHAEYLAKGGEFVTHLWALVAHAGIPNDGISVEQV